MECQGPRPEKTKNKLWSPVQGLKEEDVQSQGHRGPGLNGWVKAVARSVDWEVSVACKSSFEEEAGP